MTTSRNGRQPLAIERRLVVDLVSVAQKIPLVPLEREFDLADMAAARAVSCPRISWAVAFIKAYGLVCAQTPVLRQSYMGFPWGHIFQHPDSVAMLAIDRQTAGGRRLCWGRFTAPERTSLVDLQKQLEEYKTGPVEQVFRRQVRLSQFPRPLRRLAWWMSMNLSGERRARRLGTFGLSTLGSSGCINHVHPTCTTSSLTYGPLSPAGKMLVAIVVDHRILDGTPLAKALFDLEAALQGPVAAELRQLSQQAVAA